MSLTLKDGDLTFTPERSGLGHPRAVSSVEKRTQVLSSTACWRHRSIRTTADRAPDATQLGLGNDSLKHKGQSGEKLETSLQR